MMVSYSPARSAAFPQASTVVGPEAPEEEGKEGLETEHDHEVKRFAPRWILAGLLIFRIVNSLAINTFFQPDEYYQALEPAWQLAFGAGRGAWITWEWQHQLRSSLHPALFAALYWIAAKISHVLGFGLRWHAGLLLVTPKIAQAFCAALGDFFTWRLAQMVHGKTDPIAYATVGLPVVSIQLIRIQLLLTLANPWQWFCSTRTLSNCLETSLTVAALSFWPWHWSRQSPEIPRRTPSAMDDREKSTDSEAFFAQPLHKLPFDVRLYWCLTLAAVACILRPTNLLIWLAFACYTLLSQCDSGTLLSTRWTDHPVWVSHKSLNFGPASSQQRSVLFKHGVLASVLALTMCMDRWFYQTWTFPPLRFLYFNLAQSLAGFYGKNRWDYYLTEGVPLLLTTFLPFGLLGFFRAACMPAPTNSHPHIVLRQFAGACTFSIIALSFVSHKEVRFIYPLLPLLHILAASPLVEFFSAIRASRFKQILAVGMLLTNIGIAFLASHQHQVGPIRMMDYLRSEYITKRLLQSSKTQPVTMTVGFLMPCHSSPWRSHLVFPEIQAWALSCEPPVNLNLTQRSSYVDEADQFYADPATFLNSTLGSPPLVVIPPSIAFSWRLLPWAWLSSLFQAKIVPPTLIETDTATSFAKRWPQYLAFFEEKEPFLKVHLQGSAYVPCWRHWNAYGHDDWRRRGDVVVWCLGA